MDGQVLDVLKSSCRLKPPPLWSQIGKASTDWSLIQRRNTMKGSSTSSRTKDERTISWNLATNFPNHYDLARFASGLDVSKKSGQQMNFPSYRFLMSLILMAFLYCLWSLDYHRLPTEEPKEQVQNLKHKTTLELEVGSLNTHSSDHIGGARKSDINGLISRRESNQHGITLFKACENSGLLPPTLKVKSSFDDTEKNTSRIDIFEDLMIQWYHEDNEGSWFVKRHGDVDLKSEGDLLQLSLQLDARGDNVFHLLRAKLIAFFRSLATEVEKSPVLVSEWYF